VDFLDIFSAKRTNPTKACDAFLVDWMDMRDYYELGFFYYENR
jgi:hypothetical protein